MIAFEEILDDQLPIGGGGIASGMGDAGGIKAVIVEDRAYIPKGRVEIDRLVLAHVDKDQAVEHPDMARKKAVFRLVEILRHKARGKKLAIQTEGPRMVGAHQPRCVAAVRLTNGRSAMAADVEKGADAVGIFADDDDLFGPDTEQEIIALVRNAGDMPGQQPFPADDCVHIGLEHGIAAVKFLVETISHPGIGGEPLHQLALRFSHQIFIRALLGS
jgi:hypothetical protein